MDLSQPFRALTPTLDGPVLRVLARTTAPMTRREVTGLIGDASEAGVRKVLRRLAAQGLVIEQRIGSQYSYVANRDHILWPAVAMVMSVHERLDAKIRDHVEAWEVPALSVELFGSVAAGTSTSESDVDLMVYVPHLQESQIDSWNEQIADLRAAVERWTGNACEVLEVDLPALVEMAAGDEPVLSSPRMSIIGNLRDAIPSAASARTIQAALASSDVKAALQQIGGGDFGIVRSPELTRTIDELRKRFS